MFRVESCHLYLVYQFGQNHLTGAAGQVVVEGPVLTKGLGTAGDLVVPHVSESYE